MPRPSFNLQAIAADTESIQDDNWMISYIDVFVLMTTIFVMLLVLTRPESAGMTRPKSLVIKSDTNAKKIQSVDASIDKPALTDLAPNKLIDLTEQELPKELQQLVNSEKLSSRKGKNAPASTNHTWIENIKESIEQNRLGEHIQVQEMDEFTSLEIQSRVLFKSGASELSIAGEALLDKLVPVLSSSESLIFIEGHTDDRPIMSDEFPSNWDLASARATEVLQFFVAEGLSKKRFRAVSYGDTKPLVPNDSEENRRKNRRVSLMIQAPR